MNKDLLEHIAVLAPVQEPIIVNLKNNTVLGLAIDMDRTQKHLLVLISVKCWAC
jgi:hypothetical protein